MENVRFHCLHYNALIKTLSTRTNYSKRALELYDEMIDKKIQPDLKTFEYTLWASANLGSIKMSYDLA